MSAQALAKPESRVTVFLSYTKVDRPVAERLHQFIHQDGVDCFFAPETLEAGEYWDPKLVAEVETRAVFLVLFTAAASHSNWVQKEIAMAQDACREIWVIQDPDVDLDYLERRDLVREHNFYLQKDSEQKCFEQIARRINRRWPSRDHVYSGEIIKDNCPYPGTSSFLDPDTQGKVFFGRGRAINQLKIAIKGPERVLLVHGPSGAGKTSLLAVGLKNELPGYCWYSRRIEGHTADSLLRGVLQELCGPETSTVTAAEIEKRIIAAIQDDRHNEFVLCFDQMENLFTDEAHESQVNLFLGTLRNILAAQHAKRVTILISFRKDYLADVQPAIREYFPRNWNEVVIRKLSDQDAKACMVGPARELDVLFDDQLADELLDELGEDHGGEPIVNPMDLQKVCQRLWGEIAALAPPRQWSIDTRTLAMLSRPQRSFSNGREYVRVVLREFLHSKIAEIAAGIKAKTTRFPEKYVPLALMEFVGPHNERLPVREQPGTGKVGKLDLPVIEQLVKVGLVQSRAVHAGLREFELCHDSLAVEIAQYAKTDDSVFAVMSLGAALARESADKREFNRNSDLLEKLEAVRRIQWPFGDDEAEFLLRSALGDKRAAITATAVSLDAWAAMLAPATLAKVLKDGLANKSDESVQLDAINLLLNPKIPKLLPDHQQDLGEQLELLSMEGHLNANVRAKACEALVALGHDQKVGNLFRQFKDENSRARAKTALAFTKDAIERQPDSGAQVGVLAAFRQGWKHLGPFRRFRINKELYKWRLRKSYAWVLFLIALGAPGAAIGAIIPFFFLGIFGASLTMGTTDLGPVVGIFHGFTGGLIWGLGVTAGFLVYGVIWRGGMIRRKPAETLGFTLFGMLGAALGGFGNTGVISFVFEPGGLVNAGWLVGLHLEPTRAQRVTEIFRDTMHGWITPIFGAALGLGIAWSLVAILRDPSDSWIVKNAKSQIEIGSTIRRIAWKVCFRESWRNMLCLAIGAAAIFLLINPGDGVCDPNHYKSPPAFQDHVRVHPGVALPQMPDACKGKTLPPKWVRTSGLAVVILGGSLGQEILFLFGLLTVQYGLDVKKLKENPRFLRSSEAKIAS